MKSICWQINLQKHFGGGEVYTAFVSRALRRRGWQVHTLVAEDARFAALCEQHGVTFVGPPAAVILRMGLKSPAKAAMRAAGLPVVPGSDGPLPDAASCCFLPRSPNCARANMLDRLGTRATRSSSMKVVGLSTRFSFSKGYAPSTYLRRR